jgi:hypothetical protein
MNSFERKIMQYAKLHSDDPLAHYFIETFKESDKVRKEQARKWKQIAFALEHYQYRTTMASIKSTQVGIREFEDEEEEDIDID